MNDKSYDVVVVGAGNAALCAALSTREQGGSVLMLERVPREERGGNTMYAGGAFLMAHNGLEDVKTFVPNLSQDEIANTDFGQYTAEQYLDDIGRMTDYRIDPELADLIVRRSTETVEWIPEGVSLHRGEHNKMHGGANSLSSMNSSAPALHQRCKWMASDCAAEAHDL